MLDDARVLRNNVSYAAGMTLPPEVEETASAARELLDLATAYVTPHLPEWHADV